MPFVVLQQVAAKLSIHRNQVPPANFNYRIHVDTIKEYITKPLVTKE
jgi:hypothetical protein